MTFQIKIYKLIFKIKIGLKSRSKYIWDALHDLITFVQFKKRGKVLLLVRLQPYEYSSFMRAFQAF